MLEVILKQVRKRRKMTQKALAKRAGVTQSDISDIEQCKKDPRVSTLNKITDVLALEIMLIPRQLLPQVRALLHDESQFSTDKPKTLLELYHVPDDEDDL